MEANANAPAYCKFRRQQIISNSTNNADVRMVFNIRLSDDGPDYYLMGQNGNRSEWLSCREVDETYSSIEATSEATAPSMMPKEAEARRNWWEGGRRRKIQKGTKKKGTKRKGTKRRRKNTKRKRTKRKRN